jgi:hypothetical protein
MGVCLRWGASGTDGPSRGLPFKEGRGYRLRDVQGQRPFQDVWSGMTESGVPQDGFSLSGQTAPRRVVGVPEFLDPAGRAVPSHPDFSGAGVGTAEGGPTRFFEA